MFSKKDLNQIRSKGITIREIEKQINNFIKGFPFADLVGPATEGNGIIQFTEDEIENFIQYYDKHSPGLSITKFVPASGAATRMFKNLYEFSSWPTSEKGEMPGSFNDKSFNSVYNFLMNIESFAFRDDLQDTLNKNNWSIKKALEKNRYEIIINHLLTESGLNYGNLPKGLLKFHRYPGFSRTSFGEHLVEGAHYCKEGDDTVKVHFTISQEHLKKFTVLVSQVKNYYEDKFDVRYDISFSVQKPSTDIIAVDMDNEPFHNPDGSLLFRPGGHGALIENLNDIETNIIFIKNIDNVVPDRLKPETYKYKKLLGGYLIKTQYKLFELLQKLNTNSPDTKVIEATAAFARELGISLPDDFDKKPSTVQKDILFGYLNRPIRLCGMVKNEGEPGGGPFRVRNQQGEVSLQIIESSQINTKAPGQQDILRSSTHFNPVDIVCGIRDFRGNKFDLHQFIDPDTGFISVKSKYGKQLKAQELPGLWNGAMARWITLFVEVPIITFNPVKTVNDLLREQHQ